MIINRQSLSMAESEEFFKGDENSAELEKFAKKFPSVNAKKAKELRKKIEEMNLMKVKPENLSAIIDLLPDNNEDLNKIFIDVGLDENEAQKILDTVKEFTK